MYFLETLQICAPCHGGVLYSFDIDGMLFEFFMNVLNIENNKKFKLVFFQYFMFSSRFMLFPTFTKKNILVYTFLLFFRKTLSHFISHFMLFSTNLFFC